MAKKRFWQKLDLGHLHSQKFAGLVFGIFVLFVAAFVVKDKEKFSTMAMGVTGLYAAFVGGRAWSDGQSLKYGGMTNTVDIQVKQGVRNRRNMMSDPEPEEKEKDDEID